MWSVVKMTSVIPVLFLAALAGASALAHHPLGFVENVRGPARIVSGWEAQTGQFPHQISLRMVNSQGRVSACGGSIIHSQWAITAAHCTATRPTIVIRAGVVNMTRPEFIFETTEWFNHPLYIDILQSIVQPHDIALLKFPIHLPFSANIQPIRLQNSEDRDRNYDGVKLTASGWGMTWTGGSSPENLNWVYLIGDSNRVCHNAYSGSSIIVDSTICASAYNVSSQSTCSGDSGGPLTAVDDDGELSLVGVASFVSGTGCHTPFPAGFIRPGHYHDWYLRVTGIDFDWRRPPPPPSSEESSESSESSDSSESDSSEASGFGELSELSEPVSDVMIQPIDSSSNESS